MRRVTLDTGEHTTVAVPCGATLAATCPACATRARRLRMTQCREGWHLDHEPILDPDPPTDEQRRLATLRADLDAVRATATAGGDTADVAEAEALIDEVDTALARLGVRGRLVPERRDRPRRTRSTRHRRDTPDLPRRRVDPRTVGRTFTAADGTTWRPSLFVTLTCDSYGRVDADGTPVDPDRYDYRRAARDAIHFPKLVDRFWQNLRRTVGWNVQYFAVLEPQRRLAPHLHAAVRGTIPRAVVRQVAAATYHHVWWPPCDDPRYTADHPPVWKPELAGYVDPDTGEPLTGWDDAVDAIDPDGAPAHVVRFGAQLQVTGVVAGSPDSDRCIGYLAKYLTKSVDECHAPRTAAHHDHLHRLAETLRHEPCAPTCANWLLYGVQPRHARPGLAPGRCPGKAHQRRTLGFGGRRVLVSRTWSGKSLADHRADRRAWVVALLGVTDNPDRYGWQRVDRRDPDALPRAHLVLRAVADRRRWRALLDSVEATGPPGTHPPSPPAGTRAG